MAEIRKILGEFISYEEKTFGNKLKYAIKYKQPNGVKPDKVWEHQAADEELSEKALEILINANAGERFCVHQATVNGFPAIVDITDAADAPAKYQGKGGFEKKAWAPADKSGEAVGGAWKYAIDILTHKLDVNEVKKLVDIILPLTEEQKDKLKAIQKAKQDAAATTEAKKEEEVKPLSRAEQLKQQKAQAKKEPAKKEEVEVEDDVPDFGDEE